jgi:transposase
VPYEYADCKRPRVHIDYHVQLFDSYYSVPYELIGKRVDARVTATIVEIFDGGVRVASHKRKFQKGSVNTLPEHMPAHHQAVASWTPERMHSWATKVGPHVEEFVLALMCRKEHPEQGVRAALGTLSLVKKYSRERLNAACQRAIHYGSYTVRTIRNILENNLETQPLKKPTVKSLGQHENVRGPSYYASGSHDVPGQELLFPPDGAESKTDREVA